MSMHCSRSMWPRFAPTLALILVPLALASGAARADFSGISSHGLQQAMNARDGEAFYADHDGIGHFSLAGNFSSGHAAGNDALSDQLSSINSADHFNLDHAAELDGDGHLYTLMIDGNYDFDMAIANDLPVRPHLDGGMGMAMVRLPGASFGSGGDMLPLVRVGGGLAYQLPSAWDLSLDYKAGFGMGSQQILGQQAVDTQSVTMGMSYRF